MASNRFGRFYTFSSFGESHGKAIGGVIDGCPAGLKLSIDSIQNDLDLRKPGKKLTSPRKELDQIEILSGLIDGYTTGAPIGFVIKNEDQKKESYQTIQNLYRPGHANYTYLEKYGLFDPFGGGRASARETIVRVVAGSIAKQVLKKFAIETLAFIRQIGELKSTQEAQGNLSDLTSLRNKSPIFSIDAHQEPSMIACVEKVEQNGDSIGGVVEVMTSHLPIGLGDPIYDKLESWLAFGMLSIPGTKGFAMGLGFDGIAILGSQYHDQMQMHDGAVQFLSNQAGGTLGGISNGLPLKFQVAFKPTSSIKKPLSTVSIDLQDHQICQPISSRHDPCIAIRGTIVVEAMTNCVLLDCLLANRIVKL